MDKRSLLMFTTLVVALAGFLTLSQPVRATGARSAAVAVETLHVQAE